MSAIEQLFLEREAAEHIRSAREFVDRERLPLDRRQARASGWVLFGLAALAPAFMIFRI